MIYAPAADVPDVFFIDLHSIPEAPKVIKEAMIKDT